MQFQLQNPVGYYKDALALVAFTAAFIIALVSEIPKTIIIISLALCILVDGAFTLFPDWHCKPVGKNVATYMLLTQITAIVFVMVLLIKL